MTQNDEIYLHLKDRGPITVMDAFLKYGITRLSARIYDLKKEGYPVYGEMITVRNRYGGKCRVKQYFIDRTRL